MNTAQPLGVVPDIMAEASMFRWAGVGFGEDEWYLIHKSVKVVLFRSCSVLHIRATPPRFASGASSFVLNETCMCWR